MKFSRTNDVAMWRKPFGVYVWSDTLRFRFSWGPYFAGRWKPQFRVLR